ncbi:MAG: hypothetical protein A2219_01525 [Elusimicrobia bacterium RIFOXYA2_FULL_50_26]|nr:MAG: hypothetical protein A2219_01525 [Elusimicrobia bacterium RIFOXYA2_FULL_50_26]OGS23931.1 MAG: hypothetical protein A2314_07705 [Elusimicrobia bacterium RIFOXYB2_FULL_50_12]
MLMRSVGSKVLAMLLVGITLLSVGLVLVNIFFLKRSLTAEFNGRIVSLSENLSSNTAGQLSVALSFEDENLIKSMIDPIMKMMDEAVAKDDISYFFLYRQGGQLLYKVDHERRQDFELSPKRKPAGKFGRYSVEETVVNGARSYEISIPIVKDGADIGEMKVGFNYNRLQAIITRSVLVTSVVSLAGIAALCIIIVIYINKIVSVPLRRVTAIARDIADGNLAQDEIATGSTDEIGQLADVFNRMTRSLGRLVRRAQDIARGRVDADMVEKRISAGETLEVAAMHDDEKTKGDLEEAFDSMLAELRKLTVQARRIAADDLANPLLDIKIEGELGRAFSLMTSKLRELSRVAERLAEGDAEVKVNATGVLAGSFEKVIQSSAEMATHASRVASGDLRISVNIRSPKDALGISFSQMVENLKNLISQVKEQASVVTNAAVSLSRMAEQSTVTISGSIAQNAQMSSTSAREAHASSLRGQEIIGTLVEKITLIKTIAGTSASAMEKLSAKSSHIGEIVGLITKIADQTNLLSLNAAIEAARAGEAGRGFAVVADEVRTLAENSAGSAQEIARIVGEVQSETKEATVAAMSGQKEIASGTELTSETSRHFREIVLKIENISNQIERIAAAAEEAAAGAEESSMSAAHLSNSAKVLQDAVEKFMI